MLRTILKWSLRAFALVLAVCFVLVAIVLHRAVYDRFWDFPREQAAWEALRNERRTPSLQVGWQHYRGALHTHSHFSHDSDVSFEEILDVLRETDRDFIGLSDHCVSGEADYGLQWRGIHDGKVFMPGFEMSHGFMPWGLPSGTVLDCSLDEEALAAEIAGKGGQLFFAHTERERSWHLPELVGKEIYNIHTDFLDETAAGMALVKGPSILLNIQKFPHQSLRLVFDHPAGQLAQWDELNRERRITGIAANDSHQNIGVRIRVTRDNMLRVEDTSPKRLAEYPLTGWRWVVARLLFGPLEPGTTVYHRQLDPYEVSVSLVATHVLAVELSEVAVLDALEQGRAYVGFDSIADARGFVFLASDGPRTAVMGEYLPFGPTVTLRAASPLPVRFEVFRHGGSVFETEGYDLEWSPRAPGAYRVEASLNIRGRWVPWVITNPIFLTEPAGPNATESGHLLVSVTP